MNGLDGACRNPGLGNRSRRRWRPVGLLFLIAASACSTVMPSSTQGIEVTSMPVSQAECLLTLGNAVYRVTTPGGVEVPRDARPLNIACSKAGYQDAHLVVRSRLRGHAFDSIRVAGVVAVDAAGDVLRAGDSYPREIVVTMRPLRPAASRSAPAATGN